MPTLRLSISTRIGARKTRAGRRGNGCGGFTGHPKTKVYDAIQALTGLSRERIHQFASYEYAPGESADCFILWLAWRKQRRVENQLLSRLIHKWKARFRSIGVPVERKRAIGRRGYYRHLEKHRARARIRRAAKRATVIGAIEIALRRRLYDLIRRGRKGRSNEKGAALNLVGCSLEALRLKLEDQFSEGMSWSNYGKWHIDHRKPCASFNLINLDEQRTCFHFSNLQPLWAVDNLSKGAKEL